MISNKIGLFFDQKAAICQHECLNSFSLDHEMKVVIKNYIFKDLQNSMVTLVELEKLMKNREYRKFSGRF